MRWLLSLLLLGLMPGCNFNAPTLSQKVILDVNGKQLTARQFAQQLAYLLKDHDALSAKDPRVVKQMKKKICEEFVVQAITEEWAKNNNVVVKAEDLDAQIKSIQKSYPDDLAFQQAMAEEGTSFRDWRDRLQNSMLQKLVVRKLTDGQVDPTDKEIQTYYSEHKTEFAARERAQIRQILVATESDAKAMEEELKKGRKMTDLAKKYSISPEGPNGGNVGWMERGVSDVFEPAFHMKVGRPSPVVKSPFGYHIFELVARKPARVKDLAESRGEIKRILMEKREQSLYLTWLEEQTRKARVFKDQTFIEALKVETKGQ